MIIFVGLSIIVVQNTQAQFDATLNPPPKVINSILPDAESLQRGQQLYQANCPAWQKTNLNAFIERLPHTRDDELYEATLSGWQGLPECAPNLSDEQRWDIVNYIRTFQNT
jgi:mono/diheme cytochrome c family protein